MRKISLVILVLLLTIGVSFAQNEVPANASAIVGLPLSDAQDKLESYGYEIAYSSLMGKKEYWWSKSEKVCINVAFHKGKEHKVEEVTLLDSKECEPGIEASHKVWEKYHDGQSSTSNAEINKHRDKFTQDGYKASYWIKDLPPGKNAEYWYNETKNKCKYIVWDSQGGDVSTGNGQPSQGKNPAPVK